MAVCFAPCSTFSRPPTLVCNLSPIIIKRRISISCSSSSSSPIPARDRVIDFGRHRGMMLGALPSKYLKWVSKNLRARDFEEWAKLADEVLEDPVYKDRIEWEFAESILTGGDGETSRRAADSSSSVVDELVEFSQRFGWDNDDKVGWSRIDFSLLGTSKGRRIPRKGVSSEEAASNDNFRVLRNKKKTNKLGEEEEKEVDTRKREARIERQRLRRIRGGVKPDYLMEEKSHFEAQHQQQQQQEEDRVVNKKSNDDKKSNPFPGRESLLEKVFDGTRVR